MKATCVIVDGPWSGINLDGEEIGHYSVCLADDDGNEIGKVEHYRTYEIAVSRGLELGRLNPKLELVIEASRF